LEPDRDEPILLGDRRLCKKPLAVRVHILMQCTRQYINDDCDIKLLLVD